jgi:hypothetical protein
MDPTLWLWLFVVLVLAIAGLAIASYTRRWAKKTEAPPAGGFSLADLRKMKNDGKMSEEEYKRITERVAKAQKSQNLAPPPTRPDAGR